MNTTLYTQAQIYDIVRYGSGAIGTLTNNGAKPIAKSIIKTTGWLRQYKNARQLLTFLDNDNLINIVKTLLNECGLSKEWADFRMQKFETAYQHYQSNVFVYYQDVYDMFDVIADAVLYGK
jgi:hypothetical protein